MTSLVAIRTHRWGPDEQRLVDQLRPGLGDRLVVVFHNRADDVVPPIPVIDISDRWVRRNGLRPLGDWGWRCGDYFLYALRRARPDADHYWLIEPDVWFCGDPAAFFARADALAQDVLGVEIKPMASSHRFSRGLPDMAHWRAIFALVRLSGRAIDRLFAARQTYAQTSPAVRFFANDEVFVFSHAKTWADLTLGSLCDHLPDWFSRRQMNPDPEILVDIAETQAAPQVMHPVLTKGEFMRKLSKRLVENAGFLPTMRQSLAFFEESELQWVAQDSMSRVKDILVDSAARGKRK